MSAGVHFRVEGKPIPKARPRVTRGHTYTDDRTVTWEAEVAIAAKRAMGNTPFIPGRLSVGLTFDGARKNADIDNLAKAVLDAMNEVVYGDDSQIDRLFLARIPGKTPNPGVSVIVEQI